MPDSLAIKVGEKYSKKFKLPTEERISGRYKANAYLRKIEKAMSKKGGVKLIMCDDDFLILAKKRVNEFMIDLGVGYSRWESCQEYCERVLGFQLNADSIEGVSGRLLDESWWVRNIRKNHKILVENAARVAGLVNREDGIYCSDQTVDLFIENKDRNRRILKDITVVNELGNEFTLAELSDKSVSNPELRRGELMTRLRGFEEYGNRQGHVCDFITLTCPSKFHQFTFLNKKVVENEKYNGSTPKEAQQYLNGVWQKIRAALGNKKIAFYGFRVAEPHHDGCPHWHLFLFYKSEDRFLANKIMSKYALEMDGDEQGAMNRRIDIKKHDEKKGSACSYIAKYISKNINGKGIDADEFGNNAIDSSIRVNAWASCWGIRQFQQIGGASVTVWREMRRVGADDFPLNSNDEKIRASCDAGDWDSYNKNMGGVVCKRVNRPVKTVYESEVNEIKVDDGNFGEIMVSVPCFNRYGEEISGKVVGIKGDLGFFKTRIHNWTIVDKNKINEDASFDNLKNSEKLAVEGANQKSESWTCVNNCTEPDFYENYQPETETNEIELENEYFGDFSSEKPPDYQKNDLNYEEMGWLN